MVELRWGKKLAAALEANPAIGKWLDGLSNAELSAFHYQGGEAWRARIEADLGEDIVIESRPRLEGRQMVMMIAPKKKT